MATSADKISGSSALQNHWVSRVVAGVIDGVLTCIVAIVVCLPLIIIAELALVGWISGAVVPLVWGAFYVLYSSLMESGGGATIGKKVMKLQVVAIDGVMTFDKALKRNISKIHFAALLIDIIIGFFTDGDPRQRYLDRVAGTVARFEEKPSQVPYVPQPPPPPQYSQTPPASQPSRAAAPQECVECGGRLIDAADGRRQCIRCGKGY